MIADKPLLTEYFKHLNRQLREPGARLMIIGYGFADPHINKLLADAWEDNHSLSAFYVDPNGCKVIHGAGGKDPALPQYIPPWGFMRCIGESTRLLSSTFSGVDSGLELRKLEQFFGK